MSEEYANENAARNRRRRRRRGPSRRKCKWIRRTRGIPPPVECEHQTEKHSNRVGSENISRNGKPRYTDVWVTRPQKRYLRLTKKVSKEMQRGGLCDRKFFSRKQKDAIDSARNPRLKRYWTCYRKMLEEKNNPRYYLEGENLHELREKIHRLSKIYNSPVRLLTDREMRGYVKSLEYLLGIYEKKNLNQKKFESIRKQLMQIHMMLPINPNISDKAYAAYVEKLHRFGNLDRKLARERYRGRRAVARRRAAKRSRCIAKTRAGTRCLHRSKIGKKRCGHHDARKKMK